MTKITFEEWKKDYEDIPYIKQNYKKIHEEHGIPKECINGGEDYKKLIFLKEKLIKQFYSQGGKEVFI